MKTDCGTSCKPRKPWQISESIRRPAVCIRRRVADRWAQMSRLGCSSRPPSISVAGNSNAYRSWDTATLPTGDATYWGYFLFNFNGVNPNSNNTRVMLFSQNSSNQGMGVDFYTDTGDGRLRARGNNTNSSGFMSFDESATHLVIFRLDWSSTAASDTISLWLNPADVSSVSALGTAGVAYSGDFTPGGTPGIYLRSFDNAAANVWTFDEFRMGTSFADLTMVPEPSTYAMLLGGLAALAMLRARLRCVA